LSALLKARPVQEGVRVTQSPENADTRTVVAIVESQFALTPGCGILFDDHIEVSLDCPACCRTGRTVNFYGNVGKAVCTPTGHAFPGVLEDVVRGEAEGRTTVTYRLRYTTASFMDSKRQERSVPHPTWARVHFQLACPSCGTRNPATTQNNLVRPWSVRCKRCHETLWVDSQEMPRFRLVDENGKITYSQDRSTIGLYVTDFEKLPSATRIALQKATNQDERTLTVLSRQYQPILEQDAYAVSEPIVFSRNLERMAFALIDAGAEFRLLHAGRDIREHYVHRFEAKRPW
jgi:hypothetical protein